MSLIITYPGSEFVVANTLAKWKTKGLYSRHKFSTCELCLKPSILRLLCEVNIGIEYYHNQGQTRGFQYMKNQNNVDAGQISVLKVPLTDGQNFLQKLWTFVVFTFLQRGLPPKSKYLSVA